MAKKKLALLLDGECTHSEEAAVLQHLEGCPACAAEFRELQKLGRLMDLMEPSPPPPELLASIMEGIGNGTKSTQPAAVKTRPGRIPGSLFRDVAVAAAAALTVFWIGGSLLGPVTSSAEGRLSGAVTGYIRYTEVAVSRTNQAVSEFNNDWFYSADKFNPAKYKTGK